MPPGALELVQDHGRRLAEIEARERSIVGEIHELTLSFEKEMSGIKTSVQNCEKPLKRASKIFAWVVTTVGAAFLLLIVGAVWKMFTFHLPDAPPPSNPSELMGADHVQHAPQGQHAP